MPRWIGAFYLLILAAVHLRLFLYNKFIGDLFMFCAWAVAALLFLLFGQDYVRLISAMYG
jgi:hypothetical protein